MTDLECNVVELNNCFAHSSSMLLWGQVLGSMLDDWEENLAIITANRTKDDELVMVHLGDCLWKERGEVCIFFLYPLVS